MEGWMALQGSCKPKQLACPLPNICVSYGDIALVYPSTPNKKSETCLYVCWIHIFISFDHS